jgi:hypothetical protein
MAKITLKYPDGFIYVTGDPAEARKIIGRGEATEVKVVRPAFKAPEAKPVQEPKPQQGS